jgi:hypothetical protein
MNITCTDEDDVSETSVPDPRLDSPSALTSGVVVCGNLTAALRSRRKRHDAWTEEAIPSALEPRRYTSEASSKFEKHLTVVLNLCGLETCFLFFWKEYIEDTRYCLARCNGLSETHSSEGLYTVYPSAAPLKKQTAVSSQTGNFLLDHRASYQEDLNTCWR